jgi:regulator of cell morphogenesis and NO signaling
MIAIRRQLEDAELKKQSPSELADFIVDEYHETLRRDLPTLIDAAYKVERVHAGKADVPVGLGDLLSGFWEEMQCHMMKEEHVLFPMLRRGLHGAQVHMPIRVMEQEHDEHNEKLRRIRKLTRDYSPPPQACATWTRLYEALADLEVDLKEHIHLESDILFLQATRPR